MIPQDVAWLPLLLQIPIHELGHYVGFRACGEKPAVQLTWFGVTVGDEEMMKRLRLRQILIISYAGVFYGAAFLWIWDLVAPLTMATFLIYVIVCMLDIAQIVAVIGLIKKHGKNAVLIDTYESDIFKRHGLEKCKEI